MSSTHTVHTNAPIRAGKRLTSVGLEPTHLAITELESVGLDHSPTKPLVMATGEKQKVIPGEGVEPSY